MPHHPTLLPDPISIAEAACLLARLSYTTLTPRHGDPVLLIDGNAQRLPGRLPPLVHTGGVSHGGRAALSGRVVALVVVVCGPIAGLLSGRGRLFSVHLKVLGAMLILKTKKGERAIH